MSSPSASSGRSYAMLTVVGARPQFMKAATVSCAAANRTDLREILVHTGQHYDANMSAVFFGELGIPKPAYTLDIHGGGHGAMTGRMMIALEAVMEAERPDAVLVYGDTNSTLAGALCAAKLHIPIAHVEAGVRSFDRTMPEEINRIATDVLADLKFAPTATAVANLAAQGIHQGVIHVGDVNYDATCLLASLVSRSRIQERLGLNADGYALATVHRAAAVDDPQALAEVFAYLEAAARICPIVLPMHPRTRAAIARAGLVVEHVRLVDPVGPADMHALIQGCARVYTDSGGLQKEAYFYRKPCITLRAETEWVETVEAGWNRLWKGPDFVTPRREIEDYGDGRSAERILDEIVRYLGERRP